MSFYFIPNFRKALFLPWFLRYSPWWGTTLRVLTFLQCWFRHYQTQNFLRLLYFLTQKNWRFSCSQWCSLLCFSYHLIWKLNNILTAISLPLVRSMNLTFVPWILKSSRIFLLSPLLNRLTVLHITQVKWFRFGNLWLKGLTLICLGEQISLEMSAKMTMKKLSISKMTNSSCIFLFFMNFRHSICRQNLKIPW